MPGIRRVFGHGVVLLMNDARDGRRRSSRGCRRERHRATDVAVRGCLRKRRIHGHRGTVDTVLVSGSISQELRGQRPRDVRLQTLCKRTGLLAQARGILCLENEVAALRGRNVAGADGCGTAGAAGRTVQRADVIKFSDQGIPVAVLRSAIELHVDGGRSRSHVGRPVHAHGLVVARRGRYIQNPGVRLVVCHAEHLVAASAVIAEGHDQRGSGNGRLRKRNPVTNHVLPARTRSAPRAATRNRERDCRAIDQCWNG